MTAGYSGTPLAKKLGIKVGWIVMLFNAPMNYRELVAPLPENVRIVDDISPPWPIDEDSSGVDMMHVFTNNRDELFRHLSEDVRHLKRDGCFWVSWYKQAAKLPTEITEDTIREAALPLGLVDIKVCAVDDIWSGLKLVIRKENRL